MASVGKVVVEISEEDRERINRLIERLEEREDSFVGYNITWHDSDNEKCRWNMPGPFRWSAQCNCSRGVE